MKKYIAPLLCGVAAGALNGLFGAGGGIAAVVFLEKFMKLPPQKAHAAAVLIILAVSPVSLFFYIRNGLYDFNLTWQAAVGGIAGGFVGARLLDKISDRWLHGIFAVFMAAAAVKLFF